MKKITPFLLTNAFASGLLFSAAATNAAPKKDQTVTYQAPYVSTAPIIDGNPADIAWQNAPWRNIDKLTAGIAPSSSADFSGRYKVVWTEKHLYILAEITDDILMDSHPDALDHYWDDDALEIFIDEDNSGGDHLFTYNAFAYHVSLDNQAVDIGPFLSETDKKADKANVRVYPNHIKSQWQRSAQKPHVIHWEVQLAVYPDTYKDEYAPNETPVQSVELSQGKKLGFMMAYCDSDNPKGREHFMGDMDIAPVKGDKNRGFIDAGVFGGLELVK